MTIHVKARPEDVAPKVLAVGDPARAKMIAEDILDDARLVNDNRGYLVYTGFYKGEKITVAVHGVGAPSSLIVFEELNKLGAKVIIRLGTAGALRKGLRIGDLVVASAASCNYGGAGLGQYYPGICPPLAPDPLLVGEIYRSASSRRRTLLGPVFSSDAFYAEDKGFAEKLSRLGILAVEMEVAPLYALSWLRGFKAAALLMISNSLVEDLGYASSEELGMVVRDAALAILDVMAGVEA